MPCELSPTMSTTLASTLNKCDARPQEQANSVQFERAGAHARAIGDPAVLQLLVDTSSAHPRAAGMDERNGIADARSHFWCVFQIADTKTTMSRRLLTRPSVWTTSSARTPQTTCPPNGSGLWRRGATRTPTRLLLVSIGGASLSPSSHTHTQQWGRDRKTRHRRWRPRCSRRPTTQARCRRGRPALAARTLGFALRVWRIARGRVEPCGSVHQAPLVRKFVEAELAMVPADAAPAHAAEPQPMPPNRKKGFTTW